MEIILDDPDDIIWSQGSLWEGDSNVKERRYKNVIQSGKKMPQ